MFGVPRHGGRLLARLAAVGARLVQASGPGFVLLALGLVALGSGTFLTIVVPFYGAVTESVWPAVLWVCAVFVTYCIVYNYLMAVFTPPGNPPREAAPATGATASPSQPAAHSPSYHRHAVCSKCKRTKVPRSHHCSVCRQCVLKMDHHCIWIANCVGHNNHKYFVLFMGYVLVGCVFWTALAIPVFVDLGKQGSLYRSAMPVALLTFTAVMLVSLMLALGLMFAWQCYLVLTNQTTIEWHDNRYFRALARARGMPPYRNPFDLGSRRNLRDFLAVSDSGSLLLSLLPHTPAVRCSGLDFERAPLV